ncbi:transposase [Actinomadura livida]|uniref:transposase n=1 Tax=Actinomadura livida TaxID=79909 RepID=UPI001C88B3ED|nr:MULTISPECIES: transposase [Actinomadura]
MFECGDRADRPTQGPDVPGGTAAHRVPGGAGRGRPRADDGVLPQRHLRPRRTARRAGGDRLRHRTPRRPARPPGLPCHADRRRRPAGRLRRRHGLAVPGRDQALRHHRPGPAGRRQDLPEPARHYWRANKPWSGSYFAGTVGGAPISVLRQYIEHQNRPA